MVGVCSLVYWHRFVYLVCSNASLHVQATGTLLGLSRINPLLTSRPTLLPVRSLRLRTVSKPSEIEVVEAIGLLGPSKHLMHLSVLVHNLDVLDLLLCQLFMYVFKCCIGIDHPRVQNATLLEE